MARDHRIERDGRRLDYTCENRRFRTDTTKGHTHGEQPTRGSVFSQALAGSQEPDQFSLWLEHVVAVNDPDDECYWLMWYQNGFPTVPLSSILHREDIVNMERLFASFLQIP